MCVSGFEGCCIGAQLTGTHNSCDACSTFGIPGVEQHTHFLRDVKNASDIRNHIIENWNLANLPSALPGCAKRAQAHMAHWFNPAHPPPVLAVQDLVGSDWDGSAMHAECAPVLPVAMRRLMDSCGLVQQRCLPG